MQNDFGLGDENSTNCYICGKKFRGPTNRLYHLHTQHQIPSRHQCSNCYKYFSHGSFLKKHSRNCKSAAAKSSPVKSPQKSVESSQKSVKSPQKSVESPQKSVESSQKSVESPQISVEFRQNANVCYICGKIFSGRDAKNLHLHETHQIPSDYPCTKCGKYFYT